MSNVRVLVFGSTGAGKTSLCNALTGGSRPIGGGPIGVTKTTHCYAPFTSGDKRIFLFDTAGLHESVSGTVPADKAVLQLTLLLEQARDGFNAMIHVVSHPARITKEQEDDHEFFVKKLAQGKIPTLLAVTRCEHVDPMSSWADENRHALSRFAYAAIVPGCFASGGPMHDALTPLRESSKEALIAAIVSNALVVPYRLYGEGTGRTLSEALTRIWNDFVDWAKLPAAYRRELNESVYDLMKRLGVPEAIAAAAIQHIPELIGEVAKRVPIPGLDRILPPVVKKIISYLSRKT